MIKSCDRCGGLYTTETNDVTDHDVVGSDLPESKDGWVAFGRIKLDPETEIETFERIPPTESESSISSTLAEIRKDVAGSSPSMGLFREHCVDLLSIIDRFDAEVEGRDTALMSALRLVRLLRQEVSTLREERNSTASNMRDEIVRRVREKASHHPDCDASVICNDSSHEHGCDCGAERISALATELEAIEVKDDPYPCPRCGAPDTVNLATPPEVSIGCRECGWEAVTIKEHQ